MRYRVVENLEEDRPTILREFGTAYAAVDYLTTCWYQGESRVARMYLVDQFGEIMLSPIDLAEACTAGW